MYLTLGANLMTAARLQQPAPAFTSGHEVLMQAVALQKLMYQIREGTIDM